MANPEIEDLVWHTAVEWVIRKHALLSVNEQRSLIDWLDRDAGHRAAYEEASRLWLLSGVALRIPAIKEP